MLTKGDKLVVVKEVTSFLKEGDIVEVLDVDENGMISFTFCEGMHKGLMNNVEFEKHFKKYEEPKIVVPTVTPEMIEEIINNSNIEVATVFDKCTIVTCQLPNGFVIVESSASVSPKNYDVKTGIEICMNRIKDKVWELEGYRLQDTLFELMGADECPYDCNECPCTGCDEEDECEDECLDTDLDCNNCEYHEECMN